MGEGSLGFYPELLEVLQVNLGYLFSIWSVQLPVIQTFKLDLIFSEPPDLFQLFHSSLLQTFIFQSPRQDRQTKVLLTLRKKCTFNKKGKQNDVKGNKLCRPDSKIMCKNTHTSPCSLLFVLVSSCSSLIFLLAIVYFTSFPLTSYFFFYFSSCILEFNFSLYHCLRNKEI